MGTLGSIQASAPPKIAIARKPFISPILPCDLADRTLYTDPAHGIPVIIAQEPSPVRLAVQIDQSLGSGYDPPDLRVIIISVETMAADFRIFPVHHTSLRWEPASFANVIVPSINSAACR